MGRYAPFFIIVLALFTALLSLIGDGNYNNLVRLQNSLESQKDMNQKARSHLRGLKHEIYGIKNNDRMLEKAARNELGMAKQGEQVFIFDQYLAEAE